MTNESFSYHTSHINDQSGLTPESEPDASGKFIIFFCIFIVMVALGRVQELSPVLAKLRLSLIPLGFMLIYLTLSGRLGLPQLYTTKEARLVLIFFLICFISVPFSVWPAEAFSVCAFNFTSILGVFFCCLTVFDHKKNYHYLIWSIILSIAVLTIAVVTLPSHEGRVSVTGSYDPNDLAMMMVCTLPLVFNRMLMAKWLVRILLLLLILGMLKVILVTGSRGGIVGLAVMGVYGSITYYPKFNKLLRIFLVICAGLILYSFMPEDFLHRFESVASGSDYNFESGRIEIWKQSLILLQSKWLTGVGPYMYPVALGETTGDWKTGHNIFFQAAVELGIFGFIVFITMLRTIWKNCTTPINDYREGKGNYKFALEAVGVRAGLVGYLVSGMFLSQAYSKIIPFYLLLSYFLCRYHTEEISELPENGDDPGDSRGRNGI